ncbi:MAG: glycosyltransferase [Gemmatimonadales bacterium]|nr:glycosyltransferase [Gemmatimonadales bacterium]
MSWLLVLAAAAFGLLLLGWVAYPAVMGWIGARPRAPLADPAEWPAVSVVIATREPPEVLEARVANLRAMAYPADRLEIVVALDHAVADRAAAMRAALGPSVVVVTGGPPGGKGTALVAGVAAAAHELVLFADSTQRFLPDTLQQLVRAIGAPRVAAVSGALDQQAGDGFIDLFWRLELAIRTGQSALHSIVTTSGAIVLARKALWTPPPAGIISEDLFHTTDLVMRGHRVTFAPGALALDHRKFSRDQQYQRRVRTLTGLLQVIALRPAILLPWRNPTWLHFVLHKLVRIATPLLALLAAGAAGLWAALAAPRVALAGAGLGAAALALLALARPAMAARLLDRAGWALRLATAPLVALGNGLRGRWDVWHQHRPVGGRAA